MQNNITLSIIIVSFNNHIDTINCIKSIYDFNDLGSALEIILIDNSPDSSVKIAVEEKFNTVLCFSNLNYGYGEANNKGANVSNGKYLLFLNPDTILIDKIFLSSIKILSNEKSLAVLGFQLIDKNFNKQLSFHLINGGGLLRSFLIKILSFSNIYINGFTCISGSALLFKKKEFYECGCFDSNIFMYYEESDISIRLNKIGKRTGFIGSSKIIHIGGSSTPDKFSAFKISINSLFYFCNKHNLNFIKIINREKRLLFFKYIVYYLIDKEYSLNCFKKIKFIHQFTKS